MGAGAARLIKKAPSVCGVFVYYINYKKLATGIEPVTSALPMRRTTDCAMPAN